MEIGFCDSGHVRRGATKDGCFFRASIQPCAGQLGKARGAVYPVKPVVKAGEKRRELEPTQLLVVPNPTTGVVELRYQQCNQGEVEIIIMNTKGQAVLAVRYPQQGIGSHNEMLDVSALSPGIYYCMLRMDLATTTQMIVRLP